MKFFKKKTKVTDNNVTGGGGFRTLLGKAAGLQGSKDVLSNSTFIRNVRLSQEICENVFIDSWIGKRIVTKPVARAMKNGLFLEMESEEMEKKVWELYEDLKIEDLIIKSQTSADIYGSALVLLKDTTQDATKEAGEFKTLDPIMTEFPFFSVMPTPGDTYTAGDVSFSTLGIVADQSFVAPFVGVPVLKRIAPTYKYYGMSVYQNLWTAIINDATIMSAVANITYRSSIRHYKLKGLKNLVLANAQDKALDRMSLLDTSAGIFGSVIMDDEDEMQIVSQSLSGLAEIDQRSAERLSAATGIPATELLGKSPDGMNASGKSDEKVMNNYVAEYQMKMQDPVEKIFAALVSLVGGSGTKWKVGFNKPSVVDPAEKPDYDQKVLQNANTMINDLGMPEEVARGYLLENEIINQEQHDKIQLEVDEFETLDYEETKTA